MLNMNYNLSLFFVLLKSKPNGRLAFYLILILIAEKPKARLSISRLEWSSNCAWKQQIHTRQEYEDHSNTKKISFGQKTTIQAKE